jgi:hypothetical protein
MNAETMLERLVVLVRMHELPTDAADRIKEIATRMNHDTRRLSIADLAYVEEVWERMGRGMEEEMFCQCGTDPDEEEMAANKCKACGEQIA